MNAVFDKCFQKLSQKFCYTYEYKLKLELKNVNCQYIKWHWICPDVYSISFPVAPVVASWPDISEGGGPKILPKFHKYTSYSRFWQKNAYRDERLHWKFGFSWCYYCIILYSISISSSTLEPMGSASLYVQIMSIFASKYILYNSLRTAEFGGICER